MTVKLFIESIIKFVVGFLIVGFLIFFSAGTLAFFNGWLFMGALFIPMFFAGIVMMFKKPNLLKSRLESKEKEPEQDCIIKLSAFMFFIGFVIAGLGVRFNWYLLPIEVSIGATAVFLIAYFLYAEVLRENEHLSRVIKVQKNQKVIDTGLYGIVRHPMYASTFLLFLSIPIVLGSIYSFFVFMAYPFIIAKRIKHEERFLEENLVGYREYKNKVKYKLIPFIW